MKHWRSAAQLAKEWREFSTVVLTGDGLDEAVAALEALPQARIEAPAKIAARAVNAGHKLCTACHCPKCESSAVAAYTGRSSSHDCLDCGFLWEDEGPCA